MRINMSSGYCQISAPVASKALTSSLRSLMKIVDAKFSVIDADVPVLRAGSDLAELAKAVTAQVRTNHLARVKSECDAAQSEIEQAMRDARSIATSIDRHCDFLKSCAEHIETGAAIRHEVTDSQGLADNARTMRRVALLGDIKGLAAETANVLHQSAFEAAQHAVNTADQTRKYCSSLRCAILIQRSKCFERLGYTSEHPLADIDDHQKSRIRITVNAEKRYAKAYRKAYNNMFLKNNAVRRLPESSSDGWITKMKTANGITVSMRNK